MIIARRLVLALALSLWMGGFVFYGAVVVPLGGDVLHSHFTQGLITQQVSVRLNLIGAGALLACAWDVAVDRSGRRRGVTLVLLAATLLALLFLHPRLDALVDLGARQLRNADRFNALHTAYLRTSTLQWLLSLVLLLQSLRAWRSSDLGR